MTVYFGEIQKYVADIVAAGPKFLGQRNILSFLESVAATLDGSLEALNQGLRLSQPLRCDESALPVISRDRNLRIYPSEPIASQRYRLSRWLQLHRQRGTHQGEMRNLQPYFLDQPALPMIRIVHQSGDGARATWHTLDKVGGYSIYKAEPSNWNWDNHPEWWSRWWAIVYVSGTSLEQATTWNGGETWGEGQNWNGGSAQTFADLAAMLIDWKSAHSVCAGVAIARDPDSFNPTSAATTLPDGRTTLPTGNWGRLTDPTTGLPTRLGTASWFYDRYRT